MAAAGRRGGGCLLLGAAGVGKSLLGKRLRQAELPGRGQGAGRAPGHAAHGGHQPDGAAAAAEGDGAGAGRLHGPHLAQLLRGVRRRGVRDRCRQPHAGVLVLRPAAGPAVRRAARRRARAGPLQQDRPALLHVAGGDEVAVPHARHRLLRYAAHHDSGGQRARRHRAGRRPAVAEGHLQGPQLSCPALSCPARGLGSATGWWRGAAL